MVVFFLLLFIGFLFLKYNAAKDGGASDFAKIKGAVGEQKVNATLRALGSEYVPLYDVMIRNANGTTSQIDQLVLSEYGIFVIETKHYSGWIFGNENAENWMQVIFKEKHPFRNPVKQNWSHIYALKDVLSGFPQVMYYPIVVFSGDATLKGIESSVPVVYWRMLNDTIRTACTTKCLSGDEVLRIKHLLEAKAITEKDVRKQHVQTIQQDITERRLKIENLICPKCNGGLRLRHGRNGYFYGCANYPQCRFTLSYKATAAE